MLEEFSHLQILTLCVYLQNKEQTVYYILSVPFILHQVADSVSFSSVNFALPVAFPFRGPSGSQRLVLLCKFYTGCRIPLLSCCCLLKNCLALLLLPSKTVYVHML